MRAFRVPFGRLLPLLLLGAAALFSSVSCESIESFSDVPEIAPLRVTQKDSVLTGGAQLSQVEVTISWKDGNGDLGWIPGTDSTGVYNYFLTIEKRKNGNWMTIQPTTNSTFNGLFKNLNPEGDRSTTEFKLRGELTMRVFGFPNGFIVFPPQPMGTINGVPEQSRAGDVLRFQVQIQDRAGNLSNKITTQEVTL